jgi:Protein of unknown function (DUF2970)
MRASPIIFLLTAGENMSKRTIIQTIKSVLAAFIGVQSDKNRQIDFEQGSLTTYIIAGLVFTVLFVSAIVFVVSKVVGG